MARVRLDDELISQGICENRADALRTLMAGLVSSGGERLSSPGMMVKPGVELHVKGRIPYVGRGGLKLAGALDAFRVGPSGLNCLDVGCSTGGFTDCLLKRGAAHVLSVDVGRAQFDWSLRQDERVTLLERTNIVDVAHVLSVDVGRAQFDWSLRQDERVTLLERTNIVDVPELGYRSSADLAVCDVSFTSIATILPAVLELLTPNGAFLTLVKPQFEAPQGDVGEGGIVRDPAVHARVLAYAVELFRENGLSPLGLCASPITGAKGNREHRSRPCRACAGPCLCGRTLPRKRAFPAGAVRLTHHGRQGQSRILPPGCARGICRIS